MKDKDILEHVLKIGKLMNSCHDYRRLLNIILDESMSLTSSDAGTLYVKENDVLRFMIMKNNTIVGSINGENIPPVEMSLKNVCSYSAIKRKVVNIPDVYKTTLFAFSGPKEYDKITGYHTESMLVIPLIDNANEVIGVIQLINALDENKKIRAYTTEEENIIFSLASQSAIVLSNMLMSRQIENMMNSMADALTTAIDSRTPYTANHSRNVSRIIREFLTFAQRRGSLLVTDQDIEEVAFAALLHDVGKIGIPTDVLDKPTRLGNNLQKIELKGKYLSTLIQLDEAKGILTKEEAEEKIHTLNQYLEYITLMNHISALTPHMIENLDRLCSFSYQGISLLDEEDQKNIRIPSGTLNPEEREMVMHHAEYSNVILSKICFSSEYSNVIEYVSKHHEFLDGSGYPNHYMSEEIPLMSRVLTVVDIYESLTSKERPYKSEVSDAEAIHVLERMVSEGKLDQDVVEAFKEYLKE